MKFGKLPSLEGVDFNLRDQSPLNRELHAGVSPGTNPTLQILFGAPVWNAKSWRGSIYPADAPATAFLRHYARYFSCVELNTSHYRIPGAATVRRWQAEVTPHFKFCPKIFKGISHARNGLRDEALAKSWFQFLAELGPFAGPSFLQLPPYFDYARKSELFGFIERWPRQFELSLELRHPSWFEDGQVLPALVRYLNSRRVSLVITDVAGRRDVLHDSLSAGTALLRFVGNDLHPSDFSRASAWIKRFESWRQAGLTKLFLFIHEPEDVAVPGMTRFFLEGLRDQPQFLMHEPCAGETVGQLALEF